MVCVIACRASPKGDHKRSAVQYPMSGLSCRGIVKSALEDAGMPKGHSVRHVQGQIAVGLGRVVTLYQGGCSRTYICFKIFRTSRDNI